MAKKKGVSMKKAAPRPKAGAKGGKMPAPLGGKVAKAGKASGGGMGGGKYC